MMAKSPTTKIGAVDKRCRICGMVVKFRQSRQASLNPRRGGFCVLLAKNMEPTEAMVDQTNDNRNDYDRNHPAKHRIDESETTAENRYQDPTSPGYEIRVVEAGRGQEQRRRRSNKRIHLRVQATN